MFLWVANIHLCCFVYILCISHAHIAIIIYLSTSYCTLPLHYLIDNTHPSHLWEGQLCLCSSIAAHSIYVIVLTLFIIYISFPPLWVGGWEGENKGVVLLCTCSIKCRLWVWWASVHTQIYANLFSRKKIYCFTYTPHFRQPNTILKDTITYCLHSLISTPYVQMLCKCTHSKCNFYMRYV